MKLNKGVISAMLGFALLAVPLTASAHDYWRNRAPEPAYNSYRQAFAPRANFGTNPGQRFAANDWQWRDHWRNAYRGNYGPSVAPNCPVAAPYNQYPNSYQPSSYPQAYNNGMPYGAASMPAALGNMITRRNSAQALYQQALANGNHARARHLNHDVVALNKRIGSARTRDGYGRAYGSFAQPYASSYGNGYGYGNSNLNTFAPMLRNFIP